MGSCAVPKLLRFGLLDMQQRRAPFECCAIIVTFNPDVEGLFVLLEQVSEQCPFVLIDNSSTNKQAFLDRAASLENCLEVVPLETNIGLAAALNLGLKRARDEKAYYAILFDQDSAIEPGFVLGLQEALREAQSLSDKPVAAIGPRVSHPTLQRRTPFKIFSALFNRTDRPYPRSNTLFEADFLISSGCLIVLESLDAIGLMRESYFIDNIDLEWCFRAKSHGYELMGCNQAVLIHSIGEASENLLEKSGLIVKHSPLRSYYTTRNRFHLYGLPHAPWGWKMRDYPRFILKTLWVLVSSSERRTYWQNIRNGLRDAKRLEE